MSDRNNLDDLPRKLERWYEGRSPKDVLQDLLNTHGNYRAVSRFLNIPLVSVYNWCKKYQVVHPTFAPHGSQYLPIIASIMQRNGGTPPPSLRRYVKQMKDEIGTWTGVAAELGTTDKQLRRFRHKLRLVDTNPYDRMQIEQKGDEHYEQWYNYFGL